MLTIILHAFLLSLGLILPLGAQNIFVFNQGAAQGKLSRSLPSILTAGTADTVLIILSVTGGAVLIYYLPWAQLVLFGFGAVFLAYTGFLLWRSSSRSDTAGQPPLSAAKQVAVCASASLLNPHAIIDIFGVIGTASIQYAGWDKVVFTLVCISVSWLWFGSLAISGFLLKKIGSGGFFTLLNRLSAILLWAFAVKLFRDGWALL